MNTKNSLLAFTLVVASALVGQAEETLLVFTASWCGPCQNFKKDLAADATLAGEYPVDNIDIDVAPEVAADFAVNGVPTFILIDVNDKTLNPQKEIRRRVGYTGPQAFKAWLGRRRR